MITISKKLHRKEIWKQWVKHWKHKQETNWHGTSKNTKEERALRQKVVKRYLYIDEEIEKQKITVSTQEITASIAQITFYETIETADEENPIEWNEVV